MILDGINYPNKIVDAIKENKLVVFVGAGTSTGKPTCLPDFADLVKEIAKGTKYDFDKLDESCEVFLGRLKVNGIDVHKRTKEIIEDSCKKPNNQHRVIYNLFSSHKDIKIVTTNYDQMFEKVTEFNPDDCDVYDYPALPAGDEFNGIVHIHGNTNDTNNMILTDEDFGRAYITEGNASRFLKKLFSTYTVLFVGYSYNDIILRYLTRAMFRDNALDCYILTDQRKDDWDLLDLKPIYYPEKQHSLMENSLEKLGERSKRRLTDWKAIFAEISEQPPMDMAFDSELEYCLDNHEIEKIIVQEVEGAKWQEKLDDKGVFEGCFSKTNNSDDRTEMWNAWLCNNFIGKDDISFQKLIVKHKNLLNRSLIKTIIDYLSDQEIKIENIVFAQYILFVKDDIDDPWTLMKVVENTFNKKMYYLTFELFKLFFRVVYRYEKKLSFSEDGVDLKNVFWAEDYCIEKTWEKIKENVMDEHAYDLIIFLKEVVENIHFSYFSINKATDDREPFDLSMLDIENKEEHARDNQLVILNNIFYEACFIVEKQCVNDFKSFINLCLKSKSTLLQRIALRVLRDSDNYDSQEKFNILIDEFSLDNIEQKEQLFLLVANIWSDLAEDNKNELLDIVMRSYVDHEERTQKYEKYNWCVWINRFDDDNVRVKSFIEECKKTDGFEPREYPELNMYSSASFMRPVDVPEKTYKMKEMEPAEIIDLVLKDSDDIFDSKYDKLNSLSKCLKDNYDLTTQMIEKMIQRQEKDAGLWNAIIRVVHDSDFSFEKNVSILKRLTDNIALIDNLYDISNIIWDIMRDKNNDSFFGEFEDEILRCSKIIWDNREEINYDDSSLDFLSLNSTLGHILNAWMYMVSKYEERIIPKQYLELFENALSLGGDDAIVSICIIVGNYNFLLFRNRDWTINKLTPYLESDEKNVFNAAWTGLVYFTRTINADTADILAPIYYKALDKMQWLAEDTRKGFIGQVLTLLIFVVKDPLLDFVPKIYDNANEDDIQYFVDSINQRLREYETDEKKKWWDKWLKEFLKNRKNNYPIQLGEKENENLITLIANLEEVFDEAVSILCTGDSPKKVDTLFIYRLAEDNYAEKYPDSMVDLLLFLLSDDFEPEYAKSEIKTILKDITITSDEKKRKLQEAIIKHGIDVDLD